MAAPRPSELGGRPAYDGPVVRIDWGGEAAPAPGEGVVLVDGQVFPLMRAVRAGPDAQGRPMVSYVLDKRFCVTTHEDDPRAAGWLWLAANVMAVATGWTAWGAAGQAREPREASAGPGGPGPLGKPPPPPAAEPAEAGKTTPHAPPPPPSPASVAGGFLAGFLVAALLGVVAVFRHDIVAFAEATRQRAAEAGERRAAEAADREEELRRKRCLAGVPEGAVGVQYQGGGKATFRLEAGGKSRLFLAWLPHSGDGIRLVLLE